MHHDRSHKKLTHLSKSACVSDNEKGDVRLVSADDRREEALLVIRQWINKTITVHCDNIPYIRITSMKNSHRPWRKYRNNEPVERIHRRVYLPEICWGLWLRPRCCWTRNVWWSNQVKIRNRMWTKWTEGWQTTAVSVINWIKLNKYVCVRVNRWGNK